MLPTFLFVWILTIVPLFIDFMYLLSFLRNKQQHMKAWLGLLSMSLISLAALAGLIYAQIHMIDLFKTASYLLFLAAFFVSQLIAQWTLADLPPLYTFGTLSRRWSKFYTGFVIIYVLFALAVFILHWLKFYR